MNTTLKAALAALLAAGATTVATLPAHAAEVGDANTSTTGNAVYVQESDADLPIVGHNGQTINGAVGLPLNPTAQTPAKGAIRVQANYYRLWKDSTAGVDSRSSLYGVYAVGGVTDRLEVSAGLEKNDTNSDANAIEDILDHSGVALGVKYLVGKQNNPNDVRFAVGAGYSRALYKNMHVYGVASKAFGTGKRVITGHLGLRWDRFKVDNNAGAVTIDDKSSKVSAFAGLEVPIDSRGRFTLVGELQSKNADDDFGGAAPYSLSVRYQSDNGFSASVGVMRQGVLSDFVDKDRGLFAQVGKTF
jgi:hypothetical protein